MIDLDELMRLHEAATPGPWKEGKGVNEEKKQNTADILTRLCHREANYGGICPAGDGCPFPEKLCTEVTPKDWLEWMDADE